MNAKEYLKANHPDLIGIIDTYLPIEVDLTEVLNKYHQAKSKEEAAARLKLAEEYVERAIHIDGELDQDKALRLAAFGKEDDRLKRVSCHPNCSDSNRYSLPRKEGEG